MRVRRRICSCRYLGHFAVYSEQVEPVGLFVAHTYIQLPAFPEIYLPSIFTVSQISPELASLRSALIATVFAGFEDVLQAWGHTTVLGCGEDPSTEFEFHPFSCSFKRDVSLWPFPRSSPLPRHP